MKYTGLQPTAPCRSISEVTEYQYEIRQGPPKQVPSMFIIEWEGQRKRNTNLMGRGPEPPEHVLSISRIRSPRKLIDKSIREIAATMAIGRFYTRRV